jgi:hypothetical protein
MLGAIRYGGLAALTACLLLQQPVAAQDLRKDTEERLRVAAQRLEVMVSDAIERSDKIAKANPSGAIRILREAKSELAADTEALKPERREALGRKIDLRIKSWEALADNPVVTPGTTVKPGPGPGTPQRDPAADEARQQKELADRRFSGPKDYLREKADIERQRADGFSKEYLALLKTSIPEYRDMTFPRDWVEKMARRNKGIQLTDLEKQIVKALNTIIEVDYEGKTFKDVLDDLKERSKMPISVDPRALEDLNITYASMLNVKLGKVTTRTVLKKITAELGLTYIMKNETILITTPARAKEMLTTRMYSVADLMPAVDMRYPLLFQNQTFQAYQTIQTLVLMITQTVEPESWEINGKGGLGTITFYPPTMSLVVKQTAEMHYLMGLSGVGR